MQPLAKNFTKAILTPQDKEQLYSDLAHTMIGAMFEGHIALKDIKDSAHYILQQAETIQTYRQLFLFLNDLSDKWDIFNGVLLKYVADIDDKDIQVLERLLHKLADIFEHKEALRHYTDHNFYIHQQDNWYLRIGTRFFRHGEGGIRERLSELLTMD